MSCDPKTCLVIPRHVLQSQDMSLDHKTCFVITKHVVRAHLQSDLCAGVWGRQSPGKQREGAKPPFMRDEGYGNPLEGGRVRGGYQLYPNQVKSQSLMSMMGWLTQHCITVQVTHVLWGVVAVALLSAAKLLRHCTSF